MTRNSDSEDAMSTAHDGFVFVTHPVNTVSTFIRNLQTEDLPVVRVQNPASERQPRSASHSGESAAEVRPTQSAPVLEHEVRTGQYNPQQQQQQQQQRRRRERQHVSNSERLREESTFSQYGDEVRVLVTRRAFIRDLRRGFLPRPQMHGNAGNPSGSSSSSSFASMSEENVSPANDHGTNSVSESTTRNATSGDPHAITDVTVANEDLRTFSPAESLTFAGNRSPSLSLPSPDDGIAPWRNPIATEGLPNPQPDEAPVPHQQQQLPLVSSLDVFATAPEASTQESSEVVTPRGTGTSYLGDMDVRVETAPPTQPRRVERNSNPAPVLPAPVIEQQPVQPPRVLTPSERYEEAIWERTWRQFAADVNREIFTVDGTAYSDPDSAFAAVGQFLEQSLETARQLELSNARAARNQPADDRSPFFDGRLGRSSGGQRATSQENHVDPNATSLNPNERDNGGVGNTYRTRLLTRIAEAASDGRIPLPLVLRQYVPPIHNFLSRLLGADESPSDERRFPALLAYRTEEQRDAYLQSRVREVILFSQQSVLAFPMEAMQAQFSNIGSACDRSAGDSMPPLLIIGELRDGESDIANGNGRRDDARRHTTSVIAPRAIPAVSAAGSDQEPTSDRSDVGVSLLSFSSAENAHRAAISVIAPVIQRSVTSRQVKEQLGNGNSSPPTVTTRAFVDCFEWSEEEYAPSGEDEEESSAPETESESAVPTAVAQQRETHTRRRRADTAAPASSPRLMRVAIVEKSPGRPMLQVDKTLRLMTVSELTGESITLLRLRTQIRLNVFSEDDPVEVSWTLLPPSGTYTRRVNNEQELPEAHDDISDVAADPSHHTIPVQRQPPPQCLCLGASLGIHRSGCNLQGSC